MSLVAITAAFFAGGAYLGRDLSRGAGILWLIAAFACLIGIRFAISPLRAALGRPAVRLRRADRPRGRPDDRLLREDRPQAVWEAGGSTALFIAGFGAAGYATRRDLSALARVCFFALIALILFGIVLIFVNIPGGDLIYAILGLVIFAGFTMFDFQRLRKTTDIKAAPLLAASIFLDILNVFLLLLSIFGRR